MTNKLKNCMIYYVLINNNIIIKILSS